MPDHLSWPSADTWVNENFPGESYGQQTRLRLRGSGSSKRKRSLVYFRLPDSTHEAVINQARLIIHLKGEWPGSQTITTRRVTEDWGSGAHYVTWNNQPNTAGEDEQTDGVTDGHDGDRIEINVKDMLQDAALGAPYYGFRLSFEGSLDEDRDIYSSDAVVDSARPILYVEWTAGPSAPTNLSPGGGRVVEPEKPTLKWNFNDSIVNSVQVASNIQLNDSSDFGSPLYDETYWNAYHSWDLNDPPGGSSIYPLDPGSVWYWRVKVADNSGIWGPWSDIARFQREEKGTLTLVNPAEAPDNYVDEPTPPIDWTYEGGTATLTHVNLKQIHREGGFESKRLIYRWSDVQDTRVHIPRKGTKWSGGKFRGLRSGKTYEVTVRVWDEFEREATPGDPGYLEVVREFTYQRAVDGPAPVTACSAESHGPSVLITFSRGTQPDFFCLRADGEEVEHWIDPEDVWVSGTTYQFRYWGATIGDQVLYEVEAVQDAGGGHWKHSKGNAADSATTKIKSAFIVDTEDGTYVEIMGKDQPDVSIGSSGTTYDLLGARKPVRIVDNVRGYEGSHSGVLYTQEDRDTFVDLYGRFKELRLIISSMNIPIEFDDPPSISPAAEGLGNLGFAVSFSFFQTDEFEQMAGSRESWVAF